MQKYVQKILLLRKKNYCFETYDRTPCQHEFQKSPNFRDMAESRKVKEPLWMQISSEK